MGLAVRALSGVDDAGRVGMGRSIEPSLEAHA